MQEKSESSALPSDVHSGFHVHLISDSTGETLIHVARACIAQFDRVDVESHYWSLIRTESQMQMVCESLAARPGLVLFTVINEKLRQQLLDQCRTLNLTAVPVLEPVLAALSHFLGQAAQHLPGKQHALDNDYYKRIAAMEFALACDDGQGLDKIHKADVIILGVSRTSKTPTCLYLANRALFAANIPIVPGVDLPPVISELSTPLIVMLTREPESLIDIRKSRLRFLQETSETPYVDREQVEEEIRYAKRLAVKHGWPIIDVTRRSIEETSAEIMIQLNRKQEKAGKTA